jgi:nitrogen fixation protein
MLDVLFLQCLVDSTIKKVEDGKHFPLYYRFKVLAELDPLFFEGPWMGGHFLAVVQDDGWGAQELLQESLKFVLTELPSYPNIFQQKYWPEPWKIPLLLAYTELFHLDDLPRAARAFQRAAQMPGSPPYLQNLVARLNRPGGQYEVGLKLLNFMLESTKVDHVREALEKKKKNLEILTFLDQVKRTQFSKTFQIPKKDAWGGRLFLNSKKQWDTETPYEVVFSLRPGEP